MTEPIAQVAQTDQQPDIEPGENVRRVLRWLWAPFTYLFYLPYLGVSTVIMGSIAVFLCLFSGRVAFHMGTIWAWLLCRMTFVWVSVKGRKNAVKGQSYIIMSNHQSHFDILAFYGHWGRQFRWVMKEELRKAPGLGWYCAAGGHVFIDRSSREKAIESLKNAKPLLEGGISVVFFPEGTRSDSGRMLPLKKGGFMTALQLGLPILPVTISGSRRVLPNRTLKLLPGKINIRIHPPIDTSRYDENSRAELMEEVRLAIASGLSPWERGSDSATQDS
jgi:1-acyl-sn-glycerol-3-phosphate acyltransferase